jgi:hypothetical protein
MITRAKNIITVAITGSHAKDATCSQAATKHSTVVDLPVADLDDGTYVIKLGTFKKHLRCHMQKQRSILMTNNY